MFSIIDSLIGSCRHFELSSQKLWPNLIFGPFPFKVAAGADLWVDNAEFFVALFKKSCKTGSKGKGKKWAQLIMWINLSTKVLAKNTYHGNYCDNKDWLYGEIKESNCRNLDTCILCHVLK